jgi:hypothetical protein
MKQALQELEGPQRIMPLFKGEYLEGAWASQPTLFSPRASPFLMKEKMKKKEQQQ